MKKIYSRVTPDRLLHIINFLEPADGRVDIAPDDQYLQLAMLKMPKHKTFRAHKHIWKTPSYDKTIAQESWVVIQGSVKVFYYDLDDSLLGTEIIKQGDCSMTFEGGHNYEILEDDTIVYEFKTGPYYGQENDKEFF